MVLEDVNDYGKVILPLIVLYGLRQYTEADINSWRR